MPPKRVQKGKLGDQVSTSPDGPISETSTLTEDDGKTRRGGSVAAKGKTKPRPRRRGKVGGSKGEKKLEMKYLYESSNKSDPAVRNAAAAKKNRDKIKQKLTALKQQESSLVKETKTLKTKMKKIVDRSVSDRVGFEKAKRELQKQIMEERRLREVSVLGRNVHMMDVMQNIILTTTVLNNFAEMPYYN